MRIGRWAAAAGVALATLCGPASGQPSPTPATAELVALLMAEAKLLHEEFRLGCSQERVRASLERFDDVTKRIVELSAVYSPTPTVTRTRTAGPTPTSTRTPPATATPTLTPAPTRTPIPCKACEFSLGGRCFPIAGCTP